MRRILVVGLMGWLAIPGCSGVSATQVGQTAGGIAGATIAPGVGMQIGTLVGTLAGLVIDAQIDKVREQKERGDLTQELKGLPISQASVATDRPSGWQTRVWVDEQAKNGRLIAGHFEARNLQ